ncbi:MULTISPECIES: lmo0937 family membrane protein [unclassified Sporosarcina]|uniref:Lmo0937 family membrane protein n=1 Tax=Sporosarcina psychrophila TaxID=1476 RepID=A0ABV2K814_SPOPS
MGRIIWLLIVALFVFWLLGLVFKIGGGLIHILLVIAVIAFIFNLISGKRSV